VAGKARWGDLPTAAPVTSDEGEELLERALGDYENQHQQRVQILRLLGKRANELRSQKDND